MVLASVFVNTAFANTSEPLSVRVTMREAQSQTSGKTGFCAVLLHGLARTSGSMNKLGLALNAAGWNTVNVDYPSRNFPRHPFVGRDFNAPVFYDPCG